MRIDDANRLFIARLRASIEPELKRLREVRERAYSLERKRLREELERAHELAIQALCLGLPAIELPTTEPPAELPTPAPPPLRGETDPHPDPSAEKPRKSRRRKHPRDSKRLARIERLFREMGDGSKVGKFRAIAAEVGMSPHAVERAYYDYIYPRQRKRK
jgi:hypothetical protein